MAPKIRKKKGPRLRRSKTKQIVIDREAGLLFEIEEELLRYFAPQVQKLEAEYSGLVSEEEIHENEQLNLSEELDSTLETPAEIWHDAVTCKDFPIFYFIRPVEQMKAIHVAMAYVNSEDEPSFIFLHFVTRNLGLVDHFRRGDLVYDKAFEEVGFGMIEGDALTDGDPLAMGLFIAMLKVRSDKDVPTDKFQSLGLELREDAIENADEIWRSSDSNGNQIVTFIKECPDHEIRDLFYIAITLEDPGSQVHSLLFSFPTSDENLVDRYRHGENLQAEEVSQESSH